MSEYIKREDVINYAYEIRPCKSDYFNVGIAEEMLLKEKKEVADTLESLPYIDYDSIEGLWQMQADGTHYCNNCGHDALWKQDGYGAEYSYKEVCSEYCPHCGSKNKIRE